MAMFFFDYRDDVGFTRDDIGLELPDWETAYLEAYRAAIDIWAEARREGQQAPGGCFEIRDGSDRTVLDFPLQEALGQLVVTAPRRARPPDAPSSNESREKTLKELDAWISLGERHIADQQARVARLKAGGHDASMAERLLTTLLHTQSIREQRRARFFRMRSPPSA